MNTVLIYAQTHWIEIIGAILSLIYIYLSIKAKVSLWFFGIISSLFYIVVFYQTKFYADMSLQFYYVIISIYGWIHWKHGKSDIEELTTSIMTKCDWLITIIGTAVVYVIYYWILSKYTDSSIPKSDALVGALSVIGTWMLAKKFLENWLMWILADGLCIGLYLYKELYPTAILFVIYTAMAGVGYWEWKKTVQCADLPVS